MEQLSLWKDFGLQGLIIGALFLLLFVVLRYVTELINVHKDERREWLAAYKETNERSMALQQENNTVLRSLEATMREANARFRKFDNN